MSATIPAELCGGQASCTAPPRYLSSRRCWTAAEIDQVFPTDAAVARFHDWMRSHQIGRKRVLDILLAATYRAVGVTSLLTLNPEDFAVFGEFACVPLVTAK